jgi:D-sedoheptulose 7-phosphate isomerase
MGAKVHPLIRTNDLEAWLGSQLDEAATIQAAVRSSLPELLAVASTMGAVLRAGGQVFFFGNGGSAADAQHWAAELSGRFYLDRPPLAAHALTVNTSQITAIGNDYGFDQIFARPLLGVASPGDMAVGISTSGRSQNVLTALEAARDAGIITVGFCGSDPSCLMACCDHLISLPSSDVARIQEGHELAAHLIFAVVERLLFGE